MYKLLKQLVNMYIGSLENLSFIVLRMVYIAINSLLKMFCRLDNLIASFITLNWLYTP